MTDADTHDPREAAIYHRRFEDPDAPGKPCPIGRDLGMGYEWVQDEADFDVVDVLDEAYERAGSVTVSPDGRHADEARTGELVAGAAYRAWEQGAGHDPARTRSMAVGDVIAPPVAVELPAESQQQ